MKCEEFKEKYHKADTWGDLDRLLDEVGTDDMKKLYGALTLTSEWVSITMKDECLLGFIKPRIQVD